MSADSSSGSVPFNHSSLTAPTPVNTPLNTAPISQGLSRPTVEDIPEVSGSEDEDEDETTAAAGALAGLDGPSKSAISAIMQRKLESLIGRTSGYVDGLPTPVKRRALGLKGAALKYDELLKQHKAEVYALQKKFIAELEPLHKRRAEIISGAIEPTKEEVEAGEKEFLEEETNATPLPSADDASSTEEKVEPGISEFWLTALKNHIAFSTMITDRDEDALKYLTDITLKYLDGPTAGFIISFHFAKNDYFEDEVLTKEYRYRDELDIEGDFLYERAVGCAIRWKEDKNLTQEIEVKRQRNKATNRTRVVRRSKPTDSWFNFFSPPEPVAEEDEEDMPEDDLKELEEQLEMDYQLGQDLKDRIIPRAIDYFTGKALEWEDDDEDEDEFSDFDEDEDDLEDDDDDDVDDIPPASSRRKAAKSDNVDPQECKQQ